MDLKAKNHFNLFKTDRFYIAVTKRYIFKIIGNNFFQFSSFSRVQNSINKKERKGFLLMFLNICKKLSCYFNTYIGIFALVTKYSLQNPLLK